MTKAKINTLIASAVAVTLAGGFVATDAHAMAGDKEKCFGVVKAGANDCANMSKSHSCAGHAEMDAGGDEWIALPKGVCERLAGGSLTAVNDEAAADAEMDHGAEDDHGMGE